MAVFEVVKYYVEWCVNKNATGNGKFIFRSEGKKAEEYKQDTIEGLSADDFRNMLLLIQTMNALHKPIYWDTNSKCLRNGEIMKI